MSNEPPTLGVSGQYIGAGWSYPTQIYHASPGSYGWVSNIASHYTPVVTSQKVERQIFVAYAYGLYPRADYRRVFTTVSKALDVEFRFADEKITDMHILKKVQGYIEESQFGIYDISGWNANVTLELGLAFGLSERAFIAFDPTKTPLEEVPADLRGFDRIQYESYTELEQRVADLVSQELPLQGPAETEKPLDMMRRQVMSMLDEEDGIRIGDIAKGLGVTTELARVVIRPLIGHAVRTTGERRGTKYYRATSSPKEAE